MRIYKTERYFDDTVLANEIMRAIGLYCSKSAWVWHSVAVIPILNNKKDKRTPFWADSDFDDNLLQHLYNVLVFWTAFRGMRRRRKITWNATKRHIADLADDVKTISLVGSKPVCCLSGFSSENVSEFISKLELRLKRFDKVTKKTQTASLVYPSKVAHLLFPTLVPTYDQEIIKNEVLPKTVIGTDGSFSDYIETCWRILFSLKTAQMLLDARVKVVDHLTTGWVERGLKVDSNVIQITQLCGKLDSLVAEYALIGLARRRDIWSRPFRKK